jgi:hypothetical protein
MSPPAPPLSRGALALLGAAVTVAVIALAVAVAEGPPASLRHPLAMTGADAPFRSEALTTTR